jgi:hypothetical protein
MTSPKYKSRRRSPRRKSRRRSPRRKSRRRSPRRKSRRRSPRRKSQRRSPRRKSRRRSPKKVTIKYRGKSRRVPARYVQGLKGKDLKAQIKSIFLGRDRPATKATNKRSKWTTAFERKYGVPITNKSWISKNIITRAGIEKILDKGRGAYYSSGSRPNQSPDSWAYARLASVIMGGPARNVDSNIWDKYARTKTKKKRVVGGAIMTKFQYDKILLPADTINKCRAYIDGLDHEVGGVFGTGNKIFGSYFDTISLTFPSTVTHGPSPKVLAAGVDYDPIHGRFVYKTHREARFDFNVDPGPGRFSFHTHPAICMENHDCILAWPSGGDMIQTLSSQFLCVHFVFTVEGIYTIHVTPAFRVAYFDYFTQDCRNRISAVLGNLFGRYETARGRGTHIGTVGMVDYTKVFNTRQQYLTAANSITMNTLFPLLSPEMIACLQSIPSGSDSLTPDTTLFDVGFSTYENAKGGVVLPPIRCYGL